MAWLQPQSTRERPDTFMQLEASFLLVTNPCTNRTDHTLIERSSRSAAACLDPLNNASGGQAGSPFVTSPVCSPEMEATHGSKFKPSTIRTEPL
ncbi:hypothetical protein ACVWZV_000801 [Bradyrhizobium sp. GM5.1]